MAKPKAVETHVLGEYPTCHQHAPRAGEHGTDAPSSVTGELQGALISSDPGMEHQSISDFCVIH